MSWHIIYIKCDKGCVSDLLSRAICRLKALVCPPHIVATAGGSTGTSPGVTLVGNVGPESAAAPTRELDGEGKAGKEPWLGAHYWVEKGKAGFFFYQSAFHPDGSGKSQENLRLSCRGQASLTAQRPVTQKPPSRGCQTSPGEPQLPGPLPGDMHSLGGGGGLLGDLRATAGQRDGPMQSIWQHSAWGWMHGFVGSSGLAGGQQQ